MAKILLQTQIDTATSYDSYEQVLIEAKKITANNLVKALTEKLKPYKIRRSQIGLSLQDLNLWLLNRHPKYDGTSYLRIIDKDEVDKHGSETSYKWLIKHIEWEIQH